MIEARYWNPLSQQWYYQHYSSVEDLEEHITETDNKPTAVRVDKGDWDYDYCKVG